MTGPLYGLLSVAAFTLLSVMFVIFMIYSAILRTKKPNLGGLVPQNKKPTFKPGDLVRCKNFKTFRGTVESKYPAKLRYRFSDNTVISPTEDYVIYKEGGWDVVSKIELMPDETKPDKEQHLLTLLKKANEGREAVAQLLALAPERLKAVTPMGYRDIPKELYTKGRDKLHFTLQAPAPKFKAFALPDSGHLVEIKHNVDLGMQIYVGCRQYHLITLKQILTDLVRDCMSESRSAAGLVSASRKGIIQDSNTLTWADTELLYNKIKEL